MTWKLRLTKGPYVYIYIYIEEGEHNYQQYVPTFLAPIQSKVLEMFWYFVAPEVFRSLLSKPTRIVQLFVLQNRCNLGKDAAWRNSQMLSAVGGWQKTARV